MRIFYFILCIIVIIMEIHRALFLAFDSAIEIDNIFILHTILISSHSIYQSEHDIIRMNIAILALSCLSFMDPFSAEGHFSRLDHGDTVLYESSSKVSPYERSW